MNTKINIIFSIMLFLVLALARGIAEADFTLGTPTNLGSIVNSPHMESSPDISADGLELYFTSNRPGGLGGNDIWVTKRPSIDSAWGKPVNLGPIVNSSAAESTPTISRDGLSLYFCDWRDPRPGGHGKTDIWVTTRKAKNDEWGKPVNLGPVVNSSAYEITPEISSDGLELYFESDRPGGLGSDDIWVTRRRARGHPWGKPVRLNSLINTSAMEHCPTISSDGLTLFFDLTPSGKKIGDLMVTRRKTPQDDWGKSINLGHSASDHWASSISADGSTLYFSSNRPGGSGSVDIWKVTIMPGVNLMGQKRK